jgi:hypothetical protein
MPVASHAIAVEPDVPEQKLTGSKKAMQVKKRSEGLVPCDLTRALSASSLPMSSA